MIYKHQKKGYNQVLRIWCHGAVFSGMVLFCCLQLTCVGTCPMQCYTLLVLGGRMPLRVLWFGVSEEHNRLFTYLSLSVSKQKFNEFNTGHHLTWPNGN